MWKALRMLIEPFRLAAISPYLFVIYTRRRAHDWHQALFVEIPLGLYCLQPGIMLNVGTPGSWAAGLSEQHWGMILIMLGLIRIAALIINGRWQSGASILMRGAAAGLSAIFWSQIFAFAFLMMLERVTPPLYTFSFVVSFGFMIAGVYCAVRAAVDFSEVRVKKANPENRSRAGR